MLPQPDPAPPGPAVVTSRAPNWEAAERVRWVRGLQPLQRRLLTELAWESHPHTGLVSPGDEALLAARLESHVTSMRNALRGLIDAGHVQRVRRGARGRPAVYRVTPRLPADALSPRAAPAATALAGDRSSAGIGRRRSARVTEYRQSPLMAAVTGTGEAAEDASPHAASPRPPVASPAAEATAPFAVGGGGNASPAGGATGPRRGNAALVGEATPGLSGTASPAGEVSPGRAAALSPVQEALPPAAADKGEVSPLNASPAGEAPPNWAGLDVGFGPQPPPSPPEPATPATTAGVAGELVDAAIAALPAAHRPAITPRSRQTLAAAAVALTGRWSPAELQQQLAGDLPATITNPGGLLRHKLQALAGQPGPAQRSRRERATHAAARAQADRQQRQQARTGQQQRDRAAAVYRAHPDLLAGVAAEFLGRPGLRAAPALALLGTAVCRVDQLCAGLDPAAALRTALAGVPVPGLLLRAAAEHAAAGLPDQVRAVHAAAHATSTGSVPGDGEPPKRRG